MLSERGDFTTGTLLRQRKLFFKVVTFELANILVLELKKQETVLAVKVGH